MPNIASELKAEILRLAEKAVRSSVNPLKREGRTKEGGARLAEEGGAAGEGPRTAGVRAATAQEVGRWSTSSREADHSSHGQGNAFAPTEAGTDAGGICPAGRCLGAERLSMGTQTGRNSRAGCDQEGHLRRSGSGGAGIQAPAAGYGRIGRKRSKTWEDAEVARNE